MRQARRLCEPDVVVRGEAMRVMTQPSRCALLFATQLRCVTPGKNQGAPLRVDPECRRQHCAMRGAKEKQSVNGFAAQPAARFMRINSASVRHSSFSMIRAL